MTSKVSKDDGILLLELARESILNRFQNNKTKLQSLKESVSTEILEEDRGTFVTLHKNRKLRGCIGNIDPVKNIFQGVLDNAKNAAFNDARFTPLTHDDLSATTIEISILTRPEKLSYTDANDLVAKLRPDIDGVIVKKGHNSATFLPQVWAQLKEPETFLSHLCSKAGLSAIEWQLGRLDIFTYQVQFFEE